MGENFQMQFRSVSARRLALMISGAAVALMTAPASAQTVAVRELRQGVSECQVVLIEAPDITA